MKASVGRGEDDVILPNLVPETRGYINSHTSLDINLMAGWCSGILFRLIIGDQFFGLATISLATLDS